MVRRALRGPRAPTVSTATLRRPKGRALRVGVVADTHSAPHRRGLEHLAALKPDALFHAGDIGDLAVLDVLGAIAPVYAVRGNIDGVTRELPDVLLIDVVGGASARRVLLSHYGVAGVRVRADVARQARAEGASLVVCGHSHVPFYGVDRGLTVFNPGSMGPRRFTLPIVFGELTLSDEEPAVRHVDCETGATWLPGGPLPAAY